MTTSALVELALEAPALRRVGHWAMAAGVGGLLANGLLAALWGLALPGNDAFLWTGPANDVVGAATAAATVPVVLGLTRHLHGSADLLVLSRVTVGLAGAMIGASGLLVAGVVPLSVQVVVAIPYIGALFGWWWTAGRSARRSRRLPYPLARSAEFLGLMVVVALPVSGVAALLPQGSNGQYAVGAVGLLLGLTGFLGQPVWLVALSRYLTRADHT